MAATGLGSFINILAVFLSKWFMNSGKIDKHL